MLPLFLVKSTMHIIKHTAFNTISSVSAVLVLSGKHAFTTAAHAGIHKSDENWHHCGLIP